MLTCVVVFIFVVSLVFSLSCAPLSHILIWIFNFGKVLPEFLNAGYHPHFWGPFIYLSDTFYT